MIEEQVSLQQLEYYRLKCLDLDLNFDKPKYLFRIKLVIGIGELNIPEYQEGAYTLINPLVIRTNSGLVVKKLGNYFHISLGLNYYIAPDFNTYRIMDISNPANILTVCQFTKNEYGYDYFLIKDF